MTRRLTDRQPRRLLRMRPTPGRLEHRLDPVGLGLRECPGERVDVAQHVDPRALRALAEENALLARELGRVQSRCTRWRDDCIAQADRLEAALMRTRAAAIVTLTQLAAARDALDALHQRTAVWVTNEELVRRIGDLKAHNRTLETELATARCAPPRVLRVERVAVAAPAAARPAPALEARRVLCVGGRARQVPVYRELVERGGGRFTHVDGSAADGLPALRRALADADLVILQPGFVCQSACRDVESYCARHGVRCIQLDKTCVMGFAALLATAAIDPAGPTGPATR